MCPNISSATFDLNLWPPDRKVDSFMPLSRGTLVSWYTCFVVLLSRSTLVSWYTCLMVHLFYAPVSWYTCFVVHLFHAPVSWYTCFMPLSCGTLVSWYTCLIVHLSRGEEAFLYNHVTANEIDTQLPTTITEACFIISKCWYLLVLFFATDYFISQKSAAVSLVAVTRHVALWLTIQNLVSKN